MRLADGRRLSPIEETCGPWTATVMVLLTTRMRPFKDSKAAVFIVSRRALVALAATLTLTGLDGPAAAVAQTTPSRSNDQQVEQTRTSTHATRARRIASPSR